MRELQDLISEAIIRNLAKKVSMVSLRSITDEHCRSMAAKEREILLSKVLDKLILSQVIRLPDNQAPGAWLEGNRLPRWVSRCCEKPQFFDVAEAKGKERPEASCHLEEGVSLSEKRARAPWEGKMLGIGPSLPLSKGGLRKALIVNDYMRHRSDNPERLPVNERSLLLFGYEKELKNAHRAGLFSGRITLDDLDCYRVSEPLQGVRWPCESVDAPILIVENSTTFYSAWHANKDTPVYSAVVFGRGKMIKGLELATDSFEELREESANRCGATQLPELHYFGDIDPEGAEIPIATNRLRRKQELAPLLPARGLYRRLLDFSDQPPEHEWPKGLSRIEVSEWFGESLAELVLNGFDSKRRWAQEWITQAIFTEVFTSI